MSLTSLVFLLLHFSWLLPSQANDSLLLQATVQHGLESDSTQTSNTKKARMNGVNFMAPQFESEDMGLQSLNALNANWVALTPYAFMDISRPHIQYPALETYWGNRPENLAQLVKEARSNQLQIMLKPHFWIREQGWIGGLTLTPEDWQKWETHYFDFMLDMARRAEEHQIEVLCIGVELKTAIKNLPDLWPKLIKAIRNVYTGQLTYAANWDNYEAIDFWDQLDFIGIDAYFPLSDSRTPKIKKMVRQWQSIAKTLKQFSAGHQKPIIITEYGYRSCDYACWNQWEIEFVPDDVNINLRAQVNGYQAFYQGLWEEKWLAGVFLWRWYGDNNMGGPRHSNYTPQNKPVEMVISNWYSM